MTPRIVLAAVMTAAMMGITLSLFAAEQPSADVPRKSEPIYGYRMMSDQERNDYRERMRNARSAEDRQAIRDEHRKVMESRAKERGVTLPEPRGPGGGMGPGGGPARGMGPGYGPRGEGKGPGSRTGPRWEGEGGPGFGKGKGYGPGGKPGTGGGPGSRADCPAGQDCPGPGAGKGKGQGQRP